MKRFSFRLERVLELRQYGETLAEATLGQKAAVCSRLGQSLEANAAATLDAARERFRPGGNAADHRAGELYSHRLTRERERLLKALAAAELEREAAREVYVEASKAKELVAKLKEREEGAYYKALLHEETRTMDDLAAGAHMRASSGLMHDITGIEGQHGIVW